MIKVTCKIVNLRSCIRCEFNQNTALDIETTLKKTKTIHLNALQQYVKLDIIILEMYFLIYLDKYYVTSRSDRAK